MAYLTRTDLETHMYPEIIKRIIRDYVTNYVNLAAFPATGVAGKKYKALDTTKSYIWNVDQYEEITVIDLVAESINAAVSEAKGYLRKYNLVKLFGTDATAATITDTNLKMRVKDFACWHLVRLANPNINIDLFRTAYEDARDSYFKEIQKGNIDPEGWEYVDDNGDTGRTEGSGFSYTTNTKRGNHF